MAQLAPDQRLLDVEGLEAITFGPPPQTEIGVRVVVHGPCRRCAGAVRGWADVFVGRSTVVGVSCDSCGHAGHAMVTPRIKVTTEISPAPKPGSGDPF